MIREIDLKVKIGNVVFPGCVWAASGTFGNIEEFAQLLKLERIGAAVTKTITLEPREGNPPPRIIETSSGIVNSIGLANSGVGEFTEKIYPGIESLPVAKIVSVAGSTKKEILSLSERLFAKIAPDAIELNLSCPNVEKTRSDRLFAQNKDLAGSVTREVKNISPVPVIVKLTPQVTSIADIAESVVDAGADAVALVNTYPALPIDAEKMAPALGNATGGLSGPAIKVLALKAVNDVYNRVEKPVIGIGGIRTGKDAVEFMLAGAACVQVGTASFIRPGAVEQITEELKEYMRRKKIFSVKELTGKLKR